MLNYIWAGLIITSLVFALASDFRDIQQDTYRNGEPLPVTVDLRESYSADKRRIPVRVQIRPQTFEAFYGVDIPADSLSYSGTLIQTQDGRQVAFGARASFPEPLLTIKNFTTDEDENEPLRGTLHRFDRTNGTIETTLTFNPVRFVKLNAISRAAFNFAETAVSIALGLIGILALWLGLLKIGEDAGLIESMVRVIQPVMRPLFPEIPDGHPAMGMIVLNLAANMLGLGNAATPMGIKAMEEMQELNPTDDTATNSMVMLLAINTSSVQLVPPTLLVAIMGLQINQLIFSIILATLISTIVGITAAKVLQRLPGYRASDPQERIASSK